MLNKKEYFESNSRGVDLTRPEFILVIPLASLILCELYFFSLPLLVIANALITFVLFIIFSYFFMFVFGVAGVRESCMKKQACFVERESKILIPFLINSWFFSFYLLYVFSEKFGFVAVFTNSHLLQNNAIVNSAGNFLHLNIVLMPIFLFLLIKYKKLKFFVLFLISMFFLYFAGIKGYIFQSILLTFFLLVSGMRVYKIFLLGAVGVVLLFGYFLLYDVFLDLSSKNAMDSIYRFLAYFSGSWATASYYFEDEWINEYPAVMILSSFYKVLTLGEINGEAFYRFYDVNGYQLNVIPLFQQAYVEGGIILQVLSIYFISFIYSSLRYLTFRFNDSLYFEIAYVFACTTMIFSMFFSNIFSAFTFAFTLSTVLLMGFLSMFFKKS